MSQKKDKLPSIPMCGMLHEVTRYLTAPDMIGRVGQEDCSHSYAQQFAKDPWNYLRQQVSKGKCAIVYRDDTHMLVVTKRLTAIIDPTDLYIYGTYRTVVNLV